MEKIKFFEPKTAIEEYWREEENKVFNLACYGEMRKFYRSNFPNHEECSDEDINGFILKVFNVVYKVIRDLEMSGEACPLKSDYRTKRVTLPNGELLEKELYYPQTAMPMLYQLLILRAVEKREEYEFYSGSESKKSTFAKECSQAKKWLTMAMTVREEISARYKGDTAFFYQLNRALDHSEYGMDNIRYYIKVYNADGVIEEIRAQLNRDRRPSVCGNVLKGFHEADYLDYYQNREIICSEFIEAYFREFFPDAGEEELKRRKKGMLPYMQLDGLNKREGKRAYRPPYFE